MAVNTSPFPIRVPPASEILVRPGSPDDIFCVVEVLFLKTYRQLGLRENDCVADIGANIGAFAVLAGEKAAQVVCVEPNQAVYPVLEENVRRFLGGRGKCLRLFVSDVSGDGQRISIDDIAERLGVRFDVMKIDIEGDEAKALIGSKRTLQGLRELIMEVHSPNLLREVTAQLVAAGFQVRVLEGEGVDTFRNYRGFRSYKFARMIRYVYPLLVFQLWNARLMRKLLPEELRLLHKWCRHLIDRGPARGIYLIYAEKSRSLELE